jgi:hypothetical protein
MSNKKAWKELEKVLGDTEGKYWGEQRDRFKKFVDFLSGDLDFDTFKSYIQVVKNYKLDEKLYYYFFGFSALSGVLEERSGESWAEQGYKFLLEALSQVEEENNRAIGLVGNAFWPGVVEGFPHKTRTVWLENLYQFSLEIIDGIEDQDMKATALSRIANDLKESGELQWIRPFFENLVQRAFALKKVEDQVDALSGIVRNLGDWSESPWAVKLFKNLLNKSAEFSGKPLNHFKDSPRATFLKGFVNALEESGRPQWVQATTPAIWEKINTISLEKERAGLFDDMARAGLEAGSGEAMTQIFSRMLSEIAAMEEPEDKAEAIGNMASGLVEGEEHNAKLPEIFDQLIGLAAKMKNEEARAKALAYTVGSIADALVEISDQDWAREKLAGLLAFASSIHTDEIRADFLGNLVEVLEDAEKPEWALDYCSQIITVALGIANDESRGEALAGIADGLSGISSVSWLEALFRQLLEAAQALDNSEYRINTIFGSHGIVESALKVDPQPEWAISLMRGAFSLLKDFESSLYKSFSLKDMGEEIVPKIKDKRIMAELIDALFSQYNKLQGGEYIGEAAAGLAAGIRNIEDAVLQKDILFRLLEFSRDFTDDKVILQVTAGVIENALGIFSDIREEPWIKDAFYELLQNVEKLKDHSFRAGLLAGQRLEVRSSIALALADTANADWRDYYLQCVKTMAQLNDRDARLYAFINFAEIAMGEGTISEGLQEADWLKEIQLMIIDRVLDDLSQTKDSLDEKDLKYVHNHLSKMLAFLDRRIETGRPGIISVFPNRPSLYEGLLSKISELKEETYVEKDPFSEDVLFQICPRVTLVSSLARDFMKEKDRQWVRDFLEKILAALLLFQEPLNRKNVLQALMEGISLLDDIALQAQWFEQIMGQVSPADSFFKDIRLSVMRGFIRLGLHERAMKVALEFSDPVARIEAIRELSAILEADLPLEIMETVRELTTAESQLAITKRLLKDPDYKDRNPDQYQYDVAISFAGPDRTHAEAMAAAMEKSGLRVFYDVNFKAELWGANLIQKLYSIYSSQALYCLILFSQAYTERKWTRLELEAAQSRQLESKEPYILLLRTDESEMPSEFSARGHLSLRDHSYDEIARILVTKVMKQRRGI